MPRNEEDHTATHHCRTTPEIIEELFLHITGTKVQNITNVCCKGLTKGLVGEVFSCLGKKLGCRCVFFFRNQCRFKLLNIQCGNRFEPLVSQASDSDELMECLSGDDMHTVGWKLSLWVTG